MAHRLPIFDATVYSEVTHPLPGMRSIYVAYDEAKAALGTRVAAHALADKAWGNGKVLVLDIEHLRTDIRPVAGGSINIPPNDPATVKLVRQNVRKLVRVVEIIKAKRPRLKVGFFGIAPIGDYYTTYLYYQAQELAPTNAWWAAKLQDYTEAYRRLQEANDFLRPVADAADYLFPAPYTIETNQDYWRKFATGYLQEARRYGRKPVYSFLWPQYHPQDPALAYQFIPGDYWALQLKVSRQYADGIAVWGGVNIDATFSRKPWDPAAPWWQETEAFVKRSA
jgi:hypothetical protein